MDDINPLDVTVAYVSVIKYIKDNEVSGLIMTCIYTSNRDAKAATPL